jgi:hypothetical protein
MSEQGAMPHGITFLDNGDGTGTLGGMAQAGTAGTYPLTLTASNSMGSVSQTFNLTVSLQLVSIEITPTSTTFNWGRPKPLLATALYTDGTSGDVSTQAAWSSSDTGVATVNAAGLTAGRSAGTATISATYEGQTATSDVEILVPIAKYAYAASGGSLLIFSVDEQTGALTQTSAFVSGYDAIGSVIVDPAQHFMYVVATNLTDSFILTLAIDASTGNLTPVNQPVSVAGAGWALVFDPLGRFLYADGAARWVGGISFIPYGVLEFQVDPTTGSLTAASGSPFLSSENHEIIPYPNGKWLYDLHVTPDTAYPPPLQLLAVADNGALSVVSALSSTDWMLQLDPTGNFLLQGFDHYEDNLVYAIDPVSGELKGTAGDFGHCDLPLAWHPSGAFVHCVTGLDKWDIYWQSFSTPLSFSGDIGYPGGGSFGIPIEDPSGRFLYTNYPFPIFVIDQTNGNLLAESVTNPDYGILTFVTTSP